MKNILLISSGLLFMQNAFAQISNGVEPYWRVHTDAFAKATTVNFFNADRHLVYQEVLAGKYIKLTRRNRKKLNIVLSQVMQNSLVATNAKIETLKEPEIKESKMVSSYKEDSWRCNSTIVHQSWLQVNVENPQGRKLSVKLYNSRGNAVFMWRCVRTQYKLHNLEVLIPGAYKLIVSDGQSSYYQDIIIPQSDRQRVMINSQTH